METLKKEQKPTNFHQGHAVKRLRRDNQLTQKELGDLIGLTQQAVGRFENEQVLDKDILERFAKGLNVSPDFIKELEDDRPLASYIENNTFTTEGSASNIVGSSIGTYYSQEGETLKLVLDKLEDSYKETRRECETTINVYKEMIEFLKSEILELKEKNSQLENRK